jgi:hypothetical protein
VSRKGALRNAVATAIASINPSLPNVEPVVAPLYGTVDLATPRCPVWVAGTTREQVQGPDWNTAVIGVGVVGVTFNAEGYSLTDDSIREQELQAADALDTLMDQIVAMVTPNLADQLYLLADHRFQSVTQPLQMDTALYRENGVWLSAIFLTYLDQMDDPSEV